LPSFPGISPAFCWIQPGTLLKGSYHARHWNSSVGIAMSYVLNDAGSNSSIEKLFCSPPWSPLRCSFPGKCGRGITLYFRSENSGAVPRIPNTSTWCGT
jgi:hypothetical protein